MSRVCKLVSTSERRDVLIPVFVTQVPEAQILQVRVYTPPSAATAKLVGVIIPRSSLLPARSSKRPLDSGTLLLLQLAQLGVLNLDCGEVVLDVFDILLGYGRFGELKQG